MRHPLFCFGLVFILSGQVYPQNAVTEWFPVHIGSKWSYEHETREDNGNGIAHLETHRWKTEETIDGLRTVPQGTIVEIQVRVTDGSPPADWPAHPDKAYLIRGDCLYRPEDGETVWDRSRHQLASDFVKGLTAGWVSPDFCFPFVMHKTWGAPHGLPDWGVTRPQDAKDWEVAGMTSSDPSARDGQKTFHVTAISSYPGSGMTVDIWFEKGIGIVREEEIHHGTIGEERSRLVHFDPAPER
jgi:hypothetical protein